MIAAVVAASECPAQEWLDARRAEPFLCRANFRLGGEAKLLGELQLLEADLARTLGIRRGAEHVELYLFGDQDTYRRYLEARYPGVPYRRALFVKSSGPGMVYAYRSQEIEVDLRHETTHALLHASLAAVPLWLDEGLAEYFEMPPTERASGHPYLSGMALQAKLGLVPRLVELERKQDLDQMGRGEYRASWAWVHFMLEGPPEAGEELRGYLADLARDPDPPPLSNRLHRRLPNLEHRLAEHFAGWVKGER